MSGTTRTYTLTGASYFLLLSPIFHLIWLWFLALLFDPSGDLVVMSASRSLSLEIVDVFTSFASFASLRNSEKNPEADWFVPGFRLVSLCSLMCMGCRLSNYSSRICMYKGVPEYEGVSSCCPCFYDVC